MSVAYSISTYTTPYCTSVQPVTQRTDEELFRNMVNSDDVKAFEVLYHRHYTALCKYVYTIMQCKFTTEEVVSDVLLKIWHQRQTLQIQTNVKSYMLAAVRNLSIDYLRKRARRRTVSEDAIHPDRAADFHSSLDLIVGQEATEIVENAINRLPTQGKTIFRLSRDTGMKYREIADHMGLSIKTIETHMTRSLVFLRNEVAQKLDMSVADLV
jgi:RNA polymerase sigma-70 factor, ECF subfamily